MSDLGKNFLPPLPPGLDEVDLLAWVEGDSLPRNREVAVARWLSEHPSLARQLEAMRADREMLREMPADERAPAGLLDGVQAALQPLLERQMLLGLQEGDAVEEHPPVSLVVPPRRTIFDILLRERTGRRMALAAGLLLTVGGATYFAAMMFSGSAVQPGTTQIAQAEVEDQLLQTEPADADPLAIAGAPEAAPAETEEPTQELASVPDEPAIVEFEAEATGEGALAAMEQDAEPVPMNVDDALRLAQDNRLVIRVRLGEGIWRHQGIAERLRGVGSAGWRLSGEAPPSLAGALLPPAEVPDVGEVIRPGSVRASGQLRDVPSGALVGPPEPAMLMEPLSGEGAVYMVQSRLDRSALESLRTALRGVSASVRFEEADVPVTLERGEPGLAPSAVLWWGQPPAAWTWWTTVPVVVEPAR